MTNFPNRHGFSFRQLAGRLLICGLLAWIGLTGSVETLSAQSTLADMRSKALRASLLGSWRATVGRNDILITFAADGRYRMKDKTGAFAATESALTLTPDDGAPVTYQIEMQTSQMILSGGDLSKPLTFGRDLSGQNPFASYLRWAFNLSTQSLQEKLIRILVIGFIIFLSIGLIKLLRLISGLLIDSERGLLKFFFRRHKNRARTISSLTLNVLKYVIVFAALGRILNELGVNYTAYIASLSVIGLAIGFGSQGLVQDVVTGLFLILDDQLAVGDMVEIGGQTGIVQEVGLRSTRLQNYLGQVMVIANRNIGVVGNYSRGALYATIDVAAKEAEAAEKMAVKLKELGEVLATQFPGTVLQRPDRPEVLRLKTGEFFARFRLSLWPQQQPFVDAQIVPRVRELLIAAGLEIPNNRVTVFYRPPETIPATRKFAWQLVRGNAKTAPAMNPGEQPKPS